MQDSAAAFQGMKPHQPFPEQEPHLKCPRCDSTNTKFCYYNNYNLSQPRHFCKNCRRYWTKGGALRNIPVGGGTRKSSKRSNSSSSAGGSSSSATDADANAAPASTSNNINPPKRANSSNNSIPAAPSPNPVASTSAATSSFGLQLPRTEHFAPIFLAAPPSDQERQMLDLGGSFSSLLAASGHYGGLLESFHPTGTSILRLPNSGGLVGGTMTGSGVDLAGGAGDRGGDGENPHPTPAQGAAEDFMGLRGDPGYWNDNGGGRGGGGGGGWPGLSMYTPGSTFRQ